MTTPLSPQQQYTKGKNLYKICSAIFSNKHYYKQATKTKRTVIYSHSSGVDNKVPQLQTAKFKLLTTIIK